MSPVRNTSIAFRATMTAGSYSVPRRSSVASCSDGANDPELYGNNRPVLYRSLKVPTMGCHARSKVVSAAARARTHTHSHTHSHSHSHRHTTYQIGCSQGGAPALAGWRVQRVAGNNPAVEACICAV